MRVPEGSTLFAASTPAPLYFVHSFGVRHWELDSTGSPLRAPLVTWAHHGEDFVAAVENGALAATQFHPREVGRRRGAGPAELAAGRRRVSTR